ncbi:phosphohydrolase [Calothrix sp. PCC 7716]|nr:phosphohydrolase [Calothrix sp. PCC 7716]
MSRQSRIGTYEWCEQNNGQLNRSEKFELVRMLIRSQLENLLEKLAYNSGMKSERFLRIDANAITLPDSKIALEAELLAKNSFTDAQLNHGYRTYFWGSLLGQAGLLQPDSELLFVGSILHDLGLSQLHIKQACTCCFSINGARLAHQFAILQGWDAHRAKTLYETISLHLNPIVDVAIDGVEAKLLKDGATMDVIGVRFHCLPSGAIQTVHAQFPRIGFREEILASINNVPHAQDSRPQFLSRGFSILAARNPLDRRKFNSISQTRR